jgi:hypothetical protein
VKEIGGYMQFERFNGEHYQKGLPLNTGRGAILILLRMLNAKKIYIPYYLCDSIKNYLQTNDFAYEFYHINRDFFPLFERDLKNDEYLLIVNIYGQLSSTDIANIKKKYNNIILDNTHAFFELPQPNIHTVYSCRKFFGVPDGAYLHIANFSHTLNTISLAEDKSLNRFNHLLGRFEESASEHYSEFLNTESIFASLPPLKMSKLTSNLLNIIDYAHILKIRNNNFERYAKALAPTNLIDARMLNGPFCYPYRIKNGAQIRQSLIEKKIYIPILWPNVTKSYGASDEEFDMAQNTLPLPVGQGVSFEDIDLIIEALQDLHA